MASLPCGPGREDGGDLGALQTDRHTGCVLSRAGASCHMVIRSAAPQEGDRPFLEPGPSFCRLRLEWAVGSTDISDHF